MIDYKKIKAIAWDFDDTLFAHANHKTETEKEEISDSAKNSNIKIALIQNYPEAEIISNENDLQHGIFIYNNENYSFEVEDNILFIKQDKKLVKYIYLN